MVNIKLEKIEKTIFGSWNNNFKGYVINYSDILTKLIQEAGRWCERYASDLFIDWEYLVKSMEKPNYTGGQYLFCMREDGVDNYQTAATRITESCYGYNSDYYRAIWVLNVIVKDEVIRMELGKTNSYELEKVAKENSKEFITN